MQILNDLMNLARRYAPTVLAHLIFLIWIFLFVLDRAALPDGQSLWTNAAIGIDAGLKAVSLDEKRWFVLVPLLIAYLTAFEWLRGVITSLPLLRITYRSRFSVHLIARACSVLELEPEPADITSKLARLIDRSTEEARLTGQEGAYRWMQNREDVLRTYYGSVLLGMIALIAWDLSGARFATSGSAIMHSLLLLLAIAVGLRFYIRKQIYRRLDYTASWALARTGRDDRDFWSSEDRRYFLAQRAAEIHHALMRHPFSIISNVLWRLPENWASFIRSYLQFPAAGLNQDWKLILSEKRRFGDDPVPQASALDARPFACRFTPLLERAGTGLFILVPRDSGLALGARNEGSSFDLATRLHGWGEVAVDLSAGRNLREDRHASLSVLARDGLIFIADAGPFPLQDLILGQRPDDREGWRQIFSHSIFERLKTAAPSHDQQLVGDVPISHGAALVPGNSYVVGVAKSTGLSASIAFQCFSIEESDRLLVAWAFLRLHPAESSVMARPWWNPRSWWETFHVPSSEALKR